MNDSGAIIPAAASSEVTSESLCPVIYAFKKETAAVMMEYLGKVILRLTSVPKQTKNTHKHKYNKTHTRKSTDLVVVVAACSERGAGPAPARQVYPVAQPAARNRRHAAARPGDNTHYLRRILGKSKIRILSIVLKWQFEHSGFRRGARCCMGAPRGNGFLFAPLGAGSPQLPCSV